MARCPKCFGLAVESQDGVFGMPEVPGVSILSQRVPAGQMCLLWSAFDFLDGCLPKLWKSTCQMAKVVKKLVTIKLIKWVNYL